MRRVRVGGICLRHRGAEERGGDCLKYLKRGGTEKRGWEAKIFKRGGKCVKGWVP